MTSNSDLVKVGSESDEDSSDEENSELDLVFALDCTGSMGSYIDEARDNIRKIVDGIVANDSETDIRLALVEYRDHPPQDDSFVTRTHDFTCAVEEMKGWLTDCSADGGGDAPEAVADALNQVFRLTWRPESIKICVFITDAPPHGLGCGGDGFDKGCPNDIDPLRMARGLSEKGVMIYMVGCLPCINPYINFYKALAYITGGQFVPLKDAEVLTHVIIGGAQEEISLGQFVPDVDKVVREELELHGTLLDMDKLTDSIYQKLKTRGAKVWQLQNNNSCLVTVDENIKKLSNCGDISDVREILGARRGEGRGRGRGRDRGRGRGRGWGRGRGGGYRRGGTAAVSLDSPSEDWLGAESSEKNELSEAFAAIETEINLDQVARMVQKSVAQTKALLAINK